jgi:hypothetical protein
VADANRFLAKLNSQEFHAASDGNVEDAGMVTMILSING